VGGLYTSSLFNFDPKFFDAIGPAAELGRSFIRPEYQKQFTPLLLLWKGLARYAVLHAKVPVLFGAVSISNNYNRSSRELLVRFFGTQAARWRNWSGPDARSVPACYEIGNSQP